MKYYAMIGENEYEIEIDEEGVQIDGRPVDVSLELAGDADLYSMLFNGRSYELMLEASRYQYAVTVRGDQYQVQIEDERARRLNAARGQEPVPEGEYGIRAPIPGLVVQVLVEEGDEVEENQSLLILEAMKMENDIRSPRACTIKKINVAAGQRVEQNAVMLVVE
ncbi:MAG: biotin/lipoyl-binding protein [Caldilineaceae bacterium]|nr:biotin/lipoyl-binding protein [Caldilineaceae bacterium]